MHRPAKPCIRILHHWACSGGTILSRCVAALPEVLLLSEVHPLSYLRLHDPSPAYAPTDLIQQLCLPHNGRDPALCVATWNGAIDALQQYAVEHGKHLVLRSHSHVDFFCGALPASQPLVSRSLAPRHRLVELLSVRHPLDSWMSMQAQQWDRHMRFTNFAGFCERALAMLEACRKMPVLVYEQFSIDPGAGLQQLCTALQLPHHPDCFERLASVTLSGDSGRRADRISPRPRRAIPPQLRLELDRILAEDPARSPYRQLCERLGYNPDPDASHPYTLQQHGAELFS